MAAAAADAVPASQESVPGSQDEPAVETDGPLKPGQRYRTPPNGHGDRLFYESLLSQRPDSHMAQEWCVYHGILDDDKARELLELITERKKRKPLAAQSPARPSKKHKKSKKNKKHKHKSSRVVDDTVSAEDVGLSLGGDEGVGMIVM